MMKDSFQYIYIYKSVLADNRSTFIFETFKQHMMIKYNET